MTVLITGSTNKVAFTLSEFTDKVATFKFEFKSKTDSEVKLFNSIPLNKPEVRSQMFIWDIVTTQAEEDLLNNKIYLKESQYIYNIYDVDDKLLETGLLRVDNLTARNYPTYEVIEDFIVYDGQA